MTPFSTTTAIVFGGLLTAALLNRIAYAISECITRAPLLDVFISPSPGYRRSPAIASTAGAASRPGC